MLKLCWKALVLGTKLGWWVVDGIAGLVGRTSSNKPQRPAPAQQPVAASMPPIQVTIHNHIAASPPPASAPPMRTAEQAEATPTVMTMAQVLARQDHGIYITRSADFALAHPRADELLVSLDFILFHAAHRDGDPFTIPPMLDDSGPATAGWEVSSEQADEGFDATSPRPLPSPDGRLWLAQTGQPYRNLVDF